MIPSAVKKDSMYPRQKSVQMNRKALDWNSRQPRQKIPAGDNSIQVLAHNRIPINA
jgi:hypothetical protein